MAELILLVDDDPDTYKTVSAALGSKYDLQVVDTLAKALRFLRSEASEVRGVIVDINLVPGRTDNFGEDVLVQLREVSIPSIIFSASISSEEDARRAQVELYKNKFGVLNALGKRDDDPHQALRELRESVATMVTVSLGTYRTRVGAEMNVIFEQARRLLDDQVHRDERIAKQAGEVAGPSAKTRFRRSTEHARLASRAALDQTIRNYAMRLDDALNFDEIDTALADLRNELGYQ
jgi:CheY-like chemotaxis protein